MKTPRSPDDERWEKLVQHARCDPPPAINFPALLRVVHAAATPPTWADAFLAVFAFGRAVPACIGGIGVLLLFTSWEMWDGWQTLAWAQWLGASPGGLP